MQLLKRVGRWLFAMLLYGICYLASSVLTYAPGHGGPAGQVFSLLTWCVGPFLLIIYTAWPGGFWPNLHFKFGFKG